MPGLIGFSKQSLTQAAATQAIEQMQSTLAYRERFQRRPSVSRFTQFVVLGCI